MTTITVEVPDDVFSALRRSPDEFARELLQASGAQAKQVWRRQVQKRQGQRRGCDLFRLK